MRGSLRKSRLGVAAALAGLGGCSSQTDKPVGELVISVQTDMQIPKDVSAVGVKVTSGGTTRFAQWYDVGTDPDDLKIPATLGLVAGDNPADTVTIQVMGRSENKLRTLRQVVTTVPGDRAALLRMPIHWLCDGSASQPDDIDAIGDTTFDTVCSPGQSCLGGTCVDDAVDSSTLPNYQPEQVFGGAKGPGAGTCFDTSTCFATGQTESDYRLSDCTLPAVTLGSKQAGVNIALVPSNGDGICADGICYVPLDNDQDTGWYQDGDRIHLPQAVCDKLASRDIDRLELTTDCAAKTPSTPTCGPWSSVEPKSGAGGTSGTSGTGGTGGTGGASGGIGGENGIAALGGEGPGGSGDEAGGSGQSGVTSACKFKSGSASYCLEYGGGGDSTCALTGGNSLAMCPTGSTGTCSAATYNAYFYGLDASSDTVQTVCQGGTYVASTGTGGGGSGGTGATGGSSGQTSSEAGAAASAEAGAGGAPACTTASGGPLLIDDFESGDGVLPPPRVGLWQADNDGTTGATQSPPGGTSGADFLASDDGTGNLALHTSGTGFAKYAQLQVVLNAQADESCSWFDASAFTGVSFRIKGSTTSGNLRFQAAQRSITDAMYGGECTSSCGDAYGVSVPLTPDWATQTVSWSELTQQGYGAAVPFALDELGVLQWTIGTNDGPDFDFWLDDVEFTSH
jgi:hypothetical protein